MTVISFLKVISFTHAGHLLQKGMTPFDIKFRDGQANGFDIAHLLEAKAEETHAKQARQA